MFQSIEYTITNKFLLKQLQFWHLVLCQCHVLGEYKPGDVTLIDKVENVSISTASSVDKLVTL